ADSDSNIVRGLIAILQSAYDGMTAAGILSFDIQAVFRQLNLQQHISPQRRNGLRGMVERIQLLARKHAVTSGLPAEDTAASPGTVLPLCPAPRFDVQQIRRQFPVLNRPLGDGRFPVWLDSGASSQKPACVIEKEREVEEQYYA
ncbi:MAG: SufE family protein, partial [Planctomyces sp.]